MRNPRMTRRLRMRRCSVPQSARRCGDALGHGESPTHRTDRAESVAALSTLPGEKERTMASGRAARSIAFPELLPELVAGRFLLTGGCLSVWELPVAVNRLKFRRGTVIRDVG